MNGSDRCRESGAARRTAVLLAVLVTTMGVAAVARALTAGNVDGVWGNPTPAGTSEFRWCYAADDAGGAAGAPTACSTSSATIQSPPGSTTADENQVRWGSPSGGGTSDGARSGYGFNGSNSIGAIAAATPFFLGRFTHYNRPVTAGTSFTGTTLTVTLTSLLCDDGSVPAEGATQAFAYTFTHEETSNNASPCPYGNSTGNGCDDRVTVNQVPATVFTCPEGERTLLIQGFFTNASCHLSQSGSSSTSFVTGEGQDNSACLWATISAPPPSTTSTSTSTSSTSSSTSTSTSTTTSITSTTIIPACGNGTVEAGEDCDGGECCTAGCLFAGAESPCGDAGSDCTNQDTCDGAGACVDNGVRPEGTPCGDAGTACVNQDTCDDAGGCTDGGFQPPGTPCPDDGNPCTDSFCTAGGACGVPNDDPCDDGSACTAGESCSGGECTGGTPTICPQCESCDPISGGCAPGPRPAPVPPAKPRTGLDCRVPAEGRATMLIRDKEADPGDLWVWKWKKWPDTSTGTFGDPRSTTAYTVCVFEDLDGAAPTLVYQSDVPPGGTCGSSPCWRGLGPSAAPVGFRYQDKPGINDGIIKIKLKSQDGNPGKILLRGHGEHLPDTSLPFVMPVAVQLQTSAGECWGSVFPADGVLKNVETLFRARSE